MKKKVMAVYDREPRYADRFADFVNQKEQVPFSAMAFTSLEQLKDYGKGHDIDVLLITEDVKGEEAKGITAGQTIKLTEGDTVVTENIYPCIYKYQSTESIIREVVACYCANPPEQVSVYQGRDSEIIGVYSPVNRCMKTSFSLTMGQLLSKDSKVLYLNWEECSGFSGLMKTEYHGDLSDLLYCYRSGEYNWLRLGSFIYSWGGLDYIPPVRYPEDLLQMDGGQIRDFLTVISRESGYDVIIVDFGLIGKMAGDVLDVCNIIYMPVKSDCISVEKVNEFLNYLELSGREGIGEKIRQINLPYYRSFGSTEHYLEQLLWGEMGDYVRQLLYGNITVTSGGE